MCYMKYPRGEVGVRELRQNLSVYLKRVKRGETLEVNERGHRVAVLAPARSTLMERLVAAGRASAGDHALPGLLGAGEAGRCRARVSRAAEPAPNVADSRVEYALAR